MVLRFKSTLLAMLVLGAGFAAAPSAFGEYNFAPQRAPADASPERTFLSLPAGGAEPNPSAVSGDFTDFRPTPKRSPEQMRAQLQESERLRSVNNLERAKALDEELIRVRQMLNESSREEARAVAPVQNARPAVAPVADAPKAVTGMPSVETPGVNRLLGSLQDDGSRSRGERARLELLREAQVRKQRRDSGYTRASGGSKFHAAIEFNSALRGSSAPASSEGLAGAGSRDRLAEAPERPTNRQLFPVVTSDSLLLMHKFRSVDLSIDGKSASLPDERKYQLKGGDPYDASIKDALPSMPSGSSTIKGGNGLSP